MRLPKISYFISIFILGLLVGIYTTNIIDDWCTISSTFWDIKAIDLAGLLIVIGSATIISFSINNKLNDKLKLKETLLNIINDLEGKINDIYNLGYSYMHKPDLQKPNNILCLFEAAGVKIALLNDLHDQKHLEHLLPYFDDDFYYLFFAYKTALTDSPFKNNQGVYSQTQIIKFTKSYEKICDQLARAKIELFL